MCSYRTRLKSEHRLLAKRFLWDDTNVTKQSISENCLTAHKKCQGNLDCSDYSLVSGILVTYLTTNFSSSQLYPTIFAI